MTETPTPDVATPVASTLRPVTVAVVISAAANLVAGYAWFFVTPCLGVFLTAPMLVLGAFEVIYFVRAPEMSSEDLVRRTTALGVFEVILGVFNGVSLVCGIVVLIHAGRWRAQLANAAPAAASTGVEAPRPPTATE